MMLCLHDIGPDFPTNGMNVARELDCRQPKAISIPPERSREPPSPIN